MIPVVLCGGAGSRLWPLSRRSYPKQFLALTSERSMLQETLLRLPKLAGAPIIVCNEEHRFLVAEQLRQIDISDARIILEPLGRNTAPAIAMAALAQLELIDDDLLILAADHLIKDEHAFHQAIASALALSQAGYLATFGVVADSAETGYGYIEREQQAITGINAAWPIKQFVEKPDKATAQQYLASGNFYWNSGMFLFKASIYMSELKRLQPQMYEACKLTWDNVSQDADFTRLPKLQFSLCQDDSVDYAVMEKTDKAATVALDAGWSDIGSWSALAEVSEADAQGNVCTGDVLLHEVENSFVHSQSRLVGVVGMDSVVVIETPDAILVSPKDRVQEVKKLVEQLRAQQRSEADLHQKVYRPWGYYDSMDSGERHQVKRIVVNPGAKLSLQMHHHRAEHWIVVKGTACVTKGDESFILSENQSTYIPLGTSHRLENPGVIPLEMIEVQSGSYLGEDDIVRFDDQYGRN